MSSWEFERVGPMGGGSGYGRVMAGSLPQPDLLTREAIQNSVDAALKRGNGARPRVSFRLLCLRGEDKSRFIEACDLSKFKYRLPVLRGVPADSCLRHLHDKNQPLRILVVEDEGTTGLAGSLDDQESDWFRFLLSHGDSGKSDNPAEHTGGSYGYGKTALSSASRLYMVIAYSRYLSETGPRNRLMGAAYLDGFADGKIRYTGRAFFGKEMPSIDGMKVFRPWDDEDADCLAQRLSIPLRTDDQRGTTILVVDPVDEVTAHGIIASVEKWWWPRILDGDLEVVATDECQKEYRPAPQSRPDLKYYIRCWSLLTSKDATPVAEKEVVKNFNKKEGREIGALALSAFDGVLPLEDDDDGRPGELDSDLRDRVALVRVPRMIVAYSDVGGKSHATIAGVFLAHEDIDEILKLSEPPAHDKWEHTSRRLLEQYQKDIVQSVLRRVRKEAREFRQGLRPDEPPRASVADELTRLLGDLFGPGSPSRPPVPSGSSPVSITYPCGPKAKAADVGGLALKVTATVRIGLAEGETERTVRVSFACPILEDEVDGSEYVRIEVKGPNDFKVLSVENRWIFEGCLRPGEGANFEVESEAYDADWSVRLDPEVEVLG